MQADRVDFLIKCAMACAEVVLRFTEEVYTFQLKESTTTCRENFRQDHC